MVTKMSIPALVFFLYCMVNTFILRNGMRNRDKVVITILMGGFWWGILTESTSCWRVLVAQNAILAFLLIWVSQVEKER